MSHDRSVRLVFKHIVIGPGGLEFNSRAGQIGHRVANGSRHFDVSLELFPRP